MKVIQAQSDLAAIDFKSAEIQAREIARKELGDHITLVFYNDDLKLVSNHGIRCGLGESEDCGAASYAKAFDADLEVAVGDQYKFYFRSVKDYLSTEGMGIKLQYDDSVHGVF